MSAPTTLRAEVVVIGSGAGGAPAAAVLAEAGRDVLVLEAGPHLDANDFSGEEGEMIARLMRLSGTADGRMQLYAGACVGGSTVVNDALCWRPPPEVLARWRRDFGLAGLTDEALAPYVERAWRAVNASPTDRAHLNRNAHRLEVGAARLGWAAEAMPRNVRRCVNLGLCNLGCPSNAKQSMRLTYLPRAERAGARVLPHTRAVRVLLAGDRAHGVRALRHEPGRPPETLEIRAERVVLAAGVLDTPALLLRSGIGRRVGRDLQFHTSVHVAARFREPVHAYYGPTMAYAVSEFADVNGHDGPGYMIENVAAHPVTTATALPGMGEDHERAMAALPYLARALVVLRDRTRGHVQAPGAEGPGAIEYRHVAEDRRRLRDGMLAVARLYLASGALEVYLPLLGSRPVRSERDLARLADARLDTDQLTLVYAVHLFGGASMSGRHEAGFCDETGASYDVRGLHVTDASALPGNTGVNPQITVMAHALRSAEAVAAGGLPA